MLLLGSLALILIFASVILYRLLGTSRYGIDRPHNALALTSANVASGAGAKTAEPVRIVRIYFIKPSRYDEEGYVQNFRYGVQPNNTLTALTALNEAFNKRYALERN